MGNGVGTAVGVDVGVGVGVVGDGVGGGVGDGVWRRQRPGGVAKRVVRAVCRRHWCR